MRSYNLTPWRVATQLLPPALRKPRLLAWMRAVVAPLEVLTSQLVGLVDRSRYHLNLTGQVIYLEHYLNDLFDPSQRRIYIDDAGPILPDFLYTRAEAQPLYIYTMAENQPVTLYSRPDFLGAFDFIVFAPGGLLTPETLTRLRAAVDHFKPASRRYDVQPI